MIRFIYITLNYFIKIIIMPSIFYDLFNGFLKINTDSIRKLKNELEDLCENLKTKNDIDALKVLKNKLTQLLEEKHNELDKDTRKELRKLEDIIEDIDDFIDVDTKARKEETEIMDVTKEIDKIYKSCDKVPENKKDSYKQFCAKKSDIKYQKELITLQLELLKLQKNIKEKWEKLLIIFEWRDAAWKWSTIKRFREYLNPRWARVVALEKPSEVEKTQWYFQRYIQNLPSWGEMVFFDRSWYNRAWVEPVMWFVKKKDYEKFLDEVPKFEKMLVDSWIKLIKFYFSVSKDIQAERFESRRTNPLKQYKLSPIDQFSQKLWDKYSLAEYKNFSETHKKETPWVVIDSDNKKQARINAIKYVLNQFDYPEKIDEYKLKVDKKIVISWEEKVKTLKKEININEDLFD